MAAAARRYARKSRAKSTWRAYRSDWQQFKAWCQTVGLQPIPAEPRTIAIFVANQASDGLNPSTLTRRLAAIRLVHLGAGHPRDLLISPSCFRRVPAKRIRDADRRRRDGRRQGLLHRWMRHKRHGKPQAGSLIHIP
jgi:site-specific recombinase XerC